MVAYDSVIAWRTILEIIHFHGYNVPDLHFKLCKDYVQTVFEHQLYEKFGTSDIPKEKYIPLNETALLQVYETTKVKIWFQRYMKDDKSMIVIHAGQVLDIVAKELMRHILTNNTSILHESIEWVVIVYDTFQEKQLAARKVETMFTSFFEKDRITPFTIQLYDYDGLLINPLTHKQVPKQRILSDQEKTSLLNIGYISNQYKSSKKKTHLCNMPVENYNDSHQVTSDPVAKALLAKHGDIVMIERNDDYQYVFFREIV